MLSDRTLTGTDLTITVGERVGAGTHWETFDGRTADGDAVAVRSLHGELPEDEYDRFDSLAAQWRNVSGRETVRTLADWGTDPEPWVAVEYAPGELETLASGDSVEIALECDLATRADLLGDVCEAIRNYGRYGSTPYHLRIGPEAVVFRDGPDGPTAVVGDWGISGLVSDPPVTPYTAPEQLDDGNHAGQQTDVYRLGALGYHLLSGSPPFVDADRSLAEAIRNGVGDDPPEVSEDFRRVLSDAMALDPDDRQGGAYQFRRDLIDARPRVSPEERVVSGLPPLDVEDIEKGGDEENVDDVEGSSEEGSDDESEPRSVDDDDSDGEESIDAEETSDPTETSEDVARDTSSTTSWRTAGKYVAIGVVVLVVLIGGFFGTSALGLIGGGGVDPGAATSGTLATVSISGSVVDANGEPIGSSVEVTAERIADADGNTADGPTHTTTTDGGTFTLENVPTGTYEVTAAETDVFAYGMEEVEVGEDETGEVEISPTSATVSGIVVDTNGDEPDATIRLLDENDETVAATTGGRYEFTVDDLEESYTVTAEDDYESVNRLIESFGEQTTIELEEASFTFSGSVTNSDGDPIDGATVTLTNGEVLSAPTAADGGYEIENMPGGDYDLEVSADGYMTVTDSMTVDSDVTWDFELEEIGTIDGTTNASGTPARYELELLQNGEFVRETSSDPDTGEYQIENIAPGEYTLIATRSDQSREVTVQVDSGETTTQDINIDF
ncbi:carboxypeptidase regulatory-like domain-containing protein [Halorubrum cibi]|uniref:Serine/threonine protein kinase n=1 Tax=Halorubrum cibi TaxID=413815 RepID=A0A521DJX2_9EURY|nr:carboxypeptidase regulatory-like domain-containing protein [Halorubrum cibi]SMO71882.1 Serine/threonine protein kinase [Halorubrum cibi]